MERLHDLEYILPIIIGLFWAIVFLQSGLDKVFDWKENLSWLKSHFEKTFLGNGVPFLLGIVTMLEIVAGILSIYGIISYLGSNDPWWLTQALILTMITLLMLFFGQRIAKDYEGAKTIAIYLGVALISAYLLM